MDSIVLGGGIWRGSCWRSGGLEIEKSITEPVTNPRTIFFDGFNITLRIGDNEVAIDIM